MIKELTPEQIKRCDDYVEKWTKIGLNTDVLEFEASKECIIKAYEEAKHTPPTFFFRFGDPVQAAIGGAILQKISEVENDLKTLELAKIDEDVDRSKWEDVFDLAYDQLEEDKYKAKGVKEKLFAHVANEFKDYSNFKSLVNSHLNAQIYGNQDASWLAFYDYWLEEFDMECCKPLKPLMDLANHCGWWAPYENVAILQDRPESVNLDDEKRIHCEDGPAISYRTGLKIYAINGIKVSEKTIMAPETLTVQEINDETNAEARRIMTEKFGYDRYFLESGAEQLDMDLVAVSADDPDKKMPRMLLKTQHNEYYLVGTDGSTKRVYTMRVSACKTCREAHQLMSGLDETNCIAQS